ncbi:SDR family oxidoreductase [Streptomyces sp. NPDC006460]|uniref:SDR family oxidoreductase n=1 Tax=Streptomyces sp. NPDC006460 TaxID=3154304 RepID=UPI0033A480A1
MAAILEAARARRLTGRDHKADGPARTAHCRTESIADLAASGVHILPLDVSDEESVVAAVKAVEECHGDVGALVNNAGCATSWRKRGRC